MALIQVGEIFYNLPRMVEITQKNRGISCALPCAPCSIHFTKCLMWSCEMANGCLIIDFEFFFPLVGLIDSTFSIEDNMILVPGWSKVDSLFFSIHTGVPCTCVASAYMRTMTCVFVSILPWFWIKMMESPHIQLNMFVPMISRNL